MNSAHLIHHFWPCLGGMEKTLQELCPELVRQGIDCKVICLDKCSNSKTCLKSEDEFKGVKIERLSFTDIGMYKIALGAYNKAKNADIVHVHGLGFFSDLILLTKWLHRKPVVLTSYGGIFHTGSNPLKWIYFNVWNRLLLHFADRIIAISGHDLELFSKIVPQEKIELIPVPVELSAFKQSKKKKNQFVFVGRLSVNKRVDLLIESFMKTREKKARLLIVGNDFEGIKDCLERLAAGDSRIEFLGAVSGAKLKKLLAESEFFVSASDYESFGISAVEAMKAGCVPVLSGISSFRDFLDSGKNGFELDFHTSEKAGRGLEKIMAMDRKKLSVKKANSLKFVERFAPKKIAGQIAEVYNSL